MNKVQKNFRVDQELLEKVFPLVMEGLQIKTDTLARKHGFPSRYIKATDTIEYMIRETFKELIQEGFIEKDDPDLEELDMSKYVPES